MQAMQVTLLLTLGTIALGMPLDPEKHPRTFPIVTMDNFHATMITTEVNFGAKAPPNTTTTSVIAGNNKKLVLSQFDLMPDGRYSGSVFDFTHRATAGGIVYQVTPFFNETVCYKLPNSQGPPPVSENHLSKPSAAQKAWRDQLFSMLALTSSPQLDHWKKNGTKMIDGKPCTVWLDPQGKCCQQTVCFDENGNVHSSIFRQTGRTGFIQEVSLKDFRPATTAEVTLPTGCVDLLHPTINVNLERTAVNDAGLIHTANEEAAGIWEAAASPVFEGMSLAEAKKRHGTVIAMPNLPVGAAKSALGEEAIPASFDAREAWTKCDSIAEIRNQGNCGSCWAFAANEVFADRLCIGGGDTNFSGSVEYVIDCDKKDSACDGGLLDDAWGFLKSNGVPRENCVPYRHCRNPQNPNCKPKFADLVMSPQGSAAATCPTKCSNGAPLTNIKAKTAYMVSKPGDVKSMQQEIMANGPIEVAFFVYSDFQTYKSGVYHRTKSSQGPLGGHAVRVLGWGNENSVNYWLVANSWSPGWGEKGYFKIRRGTNECGIETIPVAGLV